MVSLKDVQAAKGSKFPKRKNPFAKKGKKMKKGYK